ncbi:MAG TPA: hypothetical protein VM166_15595 [Gemmatimonadaceae bacterium]|nr:hypothetical protein [Gemmatimonadaceae bacterium]
MTPPVVTPPTTGAPVPAAMIAVAAEIDGMTDQFMVSLDDDPTSKAKLSSALSALKGHLVAGNVPLCNEDVAIARGIIDSLDITNQIELAPVGLALDVVEKVLSTIK